MRPGRAANLSRAMYKIAECGLKDDLFGNPHQRQSVHSTQLHIRALPATTGCLKSRKEEARIENLIRQGLMSEAGLHKIEAAKQDGSWNKLDRIDGLEMPQDLAKALAANEAAAKNFNAFSASAKKGIFWWIESAKRSETRGRRIGEAVELAARNKKAVYDKSR